MLPDCESNYQLYQHPKYHLSNFFGGADKPERWIDCSCGNCVTRLRFITEKHALHPDRRVHPLKATEGTAFAFTLTMPPDYVTKKPLDQLARLICENGLTNKPYEKAHKWAYVLEHTEAGTPHIHGTYETPSGRRIASKYFKRYHDLWDEKVHLGHGHKGGYHQKARHTESYDAYIDKEGVVIKSVP